MMNLSRYNPIRPHRLAMLLAVAALALTVAGCGKKSFPRPITQHAPPQVQNLKAEVVPQGVRLSWTIPGKWTGNAQEYPYRFSILKSEMGWDNRDCLGCPAMSQEAVHVVDPAFLESASISKGHILWVDHDVRAHHAYRYQIGLVDRRDQVVSTSNPAAAAILPAPPAPAELVAGKEAQGILLQWKIPHLTTGGELRFEVERRPVNGTWEKISPAPVKGSSFFDATPVALKIYDYRVMSILLAGNTTVLGQAATAGHVQAPAALPPPPPETVYAIPVKDGLEVRWTPSEGQVAGYYVYRKQGKQITRLTAKPLAQPPYLDRTAKPNEVYSYAVSAVSAKAGHREGLLSKWAEIRNVQFNQ